MIQIVFVGHDVLKKSDGYSNQAGVSNVCKAFHFTWDHDQQNNRIKNFPFFAEILNNYPLFFEKTVIEKFSDNLVPRFRYFLQLCNNEISTQICNGI